MRPRGEVPQSLPVQPEPLTDQFTPPLSFVVGVSDSAWEIARAARFGAMETEIGAAAIVRLRFTERLCIGSLESVAINVRGTLLALLVGVPEIAPVMN